MIVNPLFDIAPFSRPSSKIRSPSRLLFDIYPADSILTSLNTFC